MRMEVANSQRTNKMVAPPPCNPPYTEVSDTASHLAAGYCAATGTYSSRHPPLTAAAASFPDYLFPRLLIFPPDRPAFVDATTGAALSFAGVRARSLRAAAALRALGLRRGHVALLLAPTSLSFPVVSLGVLASGAVLSTANPLLTPGELAAQVRDSGPFLVLTTAELAPKLSSLAASPPVVVVLIDDLLTSIDDGHGEESSSAAVGSDGPALLFYSSGTTGRSKGVVSTHGNAIAAAELLQRVWCGDGDGDGDDVYGCVLPMFHMFGFSAFVLGTPAMGATAVLVPGRFSVDRLMAAMEEHRVTRLLAVPPMVVQMAKEVTAGEASSTSSARRLRLREVVSSGAPMQRKHMARFRTCFPRVTLAQCYGLTETTGVVTMCDLPPLRHDNDDGVESSNEPSSISIGRLVPSTEARIVDVDSGEALPPNRVGELWIRGPSVMQGYLRSEAATAAALVTITRSSDGGGGGWWLRTGDLCYVDSGGHIHVVDRIKELIKYKAYQVAPAELEDVLAAHPDISDAAVAPYPDEDAGEIPVACVVRKPGREQLQAQDVLSFVESRVAPYKMVRRVVFVDCIARSPSGKILRPQLKSFVRTCEMHGGAELQCTTTLSRAN